MYIWLPALHSKSIEFSCSMKTGPKTITKQLPHHAQLLRKRSEFSIYNTQGSYNQIIFSRLQKIGYSCPKGMSVYINNYSVCCRNFIYDFPEFLWENYVVLVICSLEVTYCVLYNVCQIVMIFSKLVSNMS